MMTSDIEQVTVTAFVKKGTTMMLVPAEKYRRLKAENDSLRAEVAWLWRELNRE